MRRLLVIVSVVVLAAGGCGEPGGGGAARPAADASRAAFGPVDVMFAQMSLAHIRQGEPVVALTEQRASDPAVRAVATELRTQWAAESATLAGWLADWQQPSAAPSEAGLHEGHGDLHSLRPQDVAELAAAGAADFDRTAMSLLLGHLHNTVETMRMETSGGTFPPAISLAATTTTTRQAQIQRILTLVAQQ